MSTKVYNAYRLDKSINLGEFIQTIQRVGTKRANALLEKTRTALGEAVNFSAPGPKTKLEEVTKVHKLPADLAEKVARFSIASELMTTAYRESSTKGLRSIFDFDASVTFRYLDGTWYMQVWADGPMRDAVKTILKRPGVYDFHYQNQSDKPSNVSEKVWEVRRQIWEQLYDQDIGRKTFLSLVIMDFREYEFWDISQAWKFMDEVRAEAKKRS